MGKESDVFAYLKWRGDLTFDRAPFNAVDNLILCALSYFPFDGVVQDAPIALDRAAAPMLEADTPFIFKADRALLRAAAQSARFGGVLLSGYVNRVDPDALEQFSAVTVTLAPDDHFIAFRGTDDTIVGWREDFNMSFMSPIPAQAAAAAYLEACAARLSGGIAMGGHSKGGNLAIYAALNARPDVCARLSAVYNNDGPGFDAAVIASDAYARVSPLIQTYIPQSSIIGMLLDHEGRYTIVKSRQIGLMQHDLYSWCISGPDFIRLNEVTDSSRFINRTLKEWIAEMDHDTRRAFVDALFAILSDAEISTVFEFSEARFKNARRIVKSLRTLDDSTRGLLWQVLRKLFRAARENLPMLMGRGE